MKIVPKIQQKSSIKMTKIEEIQKDVSEYTNKIKIMIKMT